MHNVYRWVGCFSWGDLDDDGLKIYADYKKKADGTII